jgi:hypothetical protein
MSGYTVITIGCATISIMSLFAHLWILKKLHGLFGQWKAIVEEDWKKRGIIVED